MTSPEAESWKGKTIVVDELARENRPSTPEIPLPAVTDAEEQELAEKDSPVPLEEKDESSVEEIVETEIEVKEEMKALEDIPSPTTAHRILFLAAWPSLLGSSEDV